MNLLRIAFDLSSDQSFALMDINTQIVIVPAVSDDLFDATQDTPNYELFWLIVKQVR